MKNQFTIALQQILDHTDLFTRKEWSEFLNATPDAIDQWIEGTDSPTLEQVHKISWAVKESDVFEQNRAIYNLFITAVNGANLN